MGFLTRVFRTTPNNPSFNLSSPEAWDAFLGGVQSASGVSVNETTALTFSPWWRGINIIARDCGKLPLEIYRRVDGGKERATDHPAWRLLRRQPNEFQTALQFRLVLTAQALSAGNGYAYIERAGDGRPLALLPLDPAAVTPVREAGRVWYVLSLQSGGMTRLPLESVLHIKGLGYDGLVGYSVVDKARDDLGLGIGARKFQAVGLKNNGRPSVVLTFPTRLDEPTRAKIREQWERMHAGVDNAAKTAILDGGMDVKTLGFSSQDMELLASRKFSIVDVANWIGLPPHKLGHDGRTSFASLEQENQSYLDDGLDFWLANWESECYERLLTEEEKAADSHIVEFNRAALVRSDLNARGNYYRTALGGHPWMTPNEVRSKENMNAVDGGDDVPQPLNMGNAGGANNTPSDPAATNTKPTRSYSDGQKMLLGQTVSRIVRRIGAMADAASRNHREFPAWVEDLSDDPHGIGVELMPTESSLEAGKGELAEKISAWLIGQLRAEYGGIMDKATPSNLHDWCKATSQRLHARLGGDAIDKFLR